MLSELVNYACQKDCHCAKDQCQCESKPAEASCPVKGGESSGSCSKDKECACGKACKCGSKAECHCSK